MNLQTNRSDDFQSRLRRLSWRVRRGMLENDLLLSRFFEQFGDSLSEAEIEALDELLDLSDGVLLKILLEDGADDVLKQWNDKPEKQKMLIALIQKITMSIAQQKKGSV